MGVKDGFNSFINSIGFTRYEPEEELYETDDEEEMDVDAIEQQSAPRSVLQAPGAASYARAQQPQRLQIIRSEPESFDACEKIATHIRGQRPVVINFENTDSHEAARIIDFLSGAVYALDGTMSQLSRHIYLVMPSSVQLTDLETHSFPMGEMSEPFVPSQWNREGHL